MVDSDGGNRIVRLVGIGLGVILVTILAFLVLRWLLGAAGWLAMPLVLLTSTFLIVLILVQRGKGGGLAGAFGGMGGQSAFGTKAGDLFTRVTMGVALFWIVLCAATLGAVGGQGNLLDQSLGGGGPVRTEASTSPADAPSTPEDGQLPAEQP